MKGNAYIVRLGVVAALCVGQSACYQGLGDDWGQIGVSELDPIEPDGTLALNSTCIALEPGEWPAAISPGGDVWLSDGERPSPNFRVFSIDGSVRVVELPHASAKLQAWNASRVHYIADDRLWLAELDSDLSEPLRWSDELPAPIDFCGDPSIDGDGFVVAGSTLVQRDAGLWWSWKTAQGEDFGAVELLGNSYGACVDRQGDTWLADERGEIWRVGPSEIWQIEALSGAQELVFDESFGTAALVDGRLIYGSPEAGWQAPDLPLTLGEDPAAKPAAIAASTGRLWLAGAFGLLAYEDGRWLEVEADGLPLGRLSSDALWADAEAAWVARDGELCRLAEGPPVQVEGLRPLQRVADALVELVVGGTGAAALGDLQLHLDGQPVAELDGGALPWQVEVDLGQAGWHTLELRASNGYQRRFEVELRQPRIGTWIDDIQPIAELHCAVNGCHGPGAADQGRPELHSYEGWVTAAESIRARVGGSGDMPPPTSRQPSWDAEEVALILTWLDAGMPSGAE